MSPGHIFLQCHLDISFCNVTWTYLFAMSPGHIVLQRHLDISFCNVTWTYLFAMSPGHIFLQCHLDIFLQSGKSHKKTLLAHKFEAVFSHGRGKDNTNLCRISHANICGFSALNRRTLLTTSGVVTFGLLPPICPGLILPVLRYLKQHKSTCFSQND